MTDTRVRAPSPPTTITKGHIPPREPVRIHESTGTASAPQGGRMLIQLITPGVGSSGVYPADVLEAAGTAQVFPAGTLMFADHPSAAQERDLPERSVRDVAGVLTEAARWDGTALVAEARVFDPWSAVLAQMHDAIGVSIRAAARVEESDREGRPIIAELVEGLSVDFVTYPGRGGAIREVYESARPTRRVVAETLPGDLVASDLEQRIDQALGPDRWVYDHTDEWVVYRDGDGLVQQTYTADAQGQITLTGQPTPVARRVTYDALLESARAEAPAHNPPASPAGVAMESHQKEEPPMAQIQIDEAEHKRLTTAAEKVTAAEEAREAAVKERDTAVKAIAEAHREADEQHIARVLEAAGTDFSKLELVGLRHDLPVTEAGRLDVKAFEQRVLEAAAEKRTANGEGRPTGFGATESTTYSQADYERDLGITTKEA